MVKKTDQNLKTDHPAPPLLKKKYKGVRMRSWGSWVSEIRAPNQKTRIWLGSYSTPEAAARAYDAALLCLKGAAASLNFPDGANSIPISRHFRRHIDSSDAVLSPKSIQRIAAAAANGFQAETLATSSPPPSSAASSPSPSDQTDDDVSLIVESGLYDGCYDGPLAAMESWPLDSPRYVDQMLTGVLFDPIPEGDFYEDGDIRLWSFC